MVQRTGARAPGGCGADFPESSASIILGTKSPNPSERAASLRLFSREYWKATYEYVRRRWRKTPVEAEEITQDFFLRTVDRDILRTYEPRRGRFRTFIRRCVDNLVVDHHRRHRRRDRTELRSSTDRATAEDIDQNATEIVDPEKMFEAKWTRSILSSAIESLRRACMRHGKEEHFRAFELYHLEENRDEPSYEAIASELGISPSIVNNRLAYARRKFRISLCEVLCGGTASTEEMLDEVRSLFSSDAASRPQREASREAIETRRQKNLL